MDPLTIRAFETSVLITVIFSLLVIAPLGAMREMSAFRYISIVSIMSLGYILVVIVAELPSYYSQNFSVERINYVNLDWRIF